MVFYPENAAHYGRTLIDEGGRLVRRDAADVGSIRRPARRQIPVVTVYRRRRGLIRAIAELVIGNRPRHRWQVPIRLLCAQSQWKATLSNEAPLRERYRLPSASLEPWQGHFQAFIHQSGSLCSP